MRIKSGKKILYLLAVGLLLGLLAGQVSAENVKIVRDEYGVPHIYAMTEEGLIFGEGYAMAEDRLFQLEMCRQAAQGRLAAAYGDDFLAYDKYQRLELFTDKDIQKMVLTLPEKQKKLYLAFAAGINAYVKEALDMPDRKLSSEFHKMGIKPVQWGVEDVIRVYLNSFYNFFDCNQELENAAFYKFALDKYGEVEGKGIFDDVIWADDPGAPVTAPSWKPPKKKAGLAVPAISNDVERISRDIAQNRQAMTDMLKSLGVPYKSGSYALALSGKKTSTGNPILLGGPQVGFGMPAFLYEAGLHGQDMDCRGFAFIGVPGFIAGQNSDIAWTSTVGTDNQVDYFLEKLNPANDKQYWYKGKWADMQKETFIIKIKGKKDEIYDVYKTIHGPVVAWDYNDPKNPTAYSKSWSYKADCLDNWICSYNLLKARNSDEFFNAVRAASFSINWLAIDRKGDISFIHGGKYPVRAAGVDPRLPGDGSGKSDWTGFLDPSELPQGKNPPEGYYVNWNNKPAPGWDNGELSPMWGMQSRVDLFNPFLQRQDSENPDFQDIKEMEKAITTTNIYAPAFKPILLKALSTHQDPMVISARRLLEGWNNRYEDQDGDGFYDSPAVLIFDSWWPILMKDIYSDDMDKYYTLACNDLGSPLTLRVLEGSKGLRHNFLNGKDPNTVMEGALQKALAEIRQKYGDDTTKWLKKVTMLKLSNTLPGSNLTMGQGNPVEIPMMNRGSGVEILEASKGWIKGVDVLPPGISGFINKERKASEHCSDQLKLYLDRRYKDMLFYPEDVQHHSETEKIREFKAQ